MARISSRFVYLAVCAVLLAQAAFACVYKYGEDPSHPFAKPGDNHFTYEFAGLDWQGTCQSGHKQSPINIPARDFDQIPSTTRTIPDFGAIKSNGTNIKVFNNMHVVQVEWADGALISNASVAVPDVKSSVLTDTLTSGDKSQRASIRPLQFHFHAHSEHSVAGAFFPLELHIVSQATQSDLPGCTGKLGCLTVVGVMFALSDDDSDSPLLTDIFNFMPSSDDKVSYLPAGKVLDLNALLPSNKSYVTYTGSLTTPPCSEEVLWHVMLTPMTMSSRQLQQFLNATGDIKCTHAHDGGEISKTPPTNQKSVKPSNAASNSSNNAVAGSTPAGKQCFKLGAGQNYRIVQPIHDRTILKYIDDGSSSSAETTAAAAVTEAANKTASATSAAFVRASLTGWLSAVAVLLAAFTM